MTDDDIIQLIETFNFDAGPVAVERRNRGFTLIHAETGVPIARLRPIGRDESSRKHQSFGPASETSGQNPQSRA